MTTTAQRILSPEEIATRTVADAAFLRLPEPHTLFAERAVRLRQLAAGHAMRDFLVFMADVADAQHGVVRAAPGLGTLPDAAALVDAARRGVAPLPSVEGPPDAAWQAGLRSLTATLRPRATPAIVAVLDRLDGWDGAMLDRQADALLNGVTQGLDLAAAPLVAAALQVWWSRAVVELQARHEQSPRGTPEPFGRVDDETLCPCCASRPTASITRLAADVAGQRYLHCSLCAAQWHLVRIKCSHCGDTRSIAYQSLEPVPGVEAAPTGPAPGAVQAETCDACGHYLKIVHMEKDPAVEPVADDLASLTLDLLVADSGRQRHGVNLMLLFGDAEDEGGPPGGGAPPPDPGAA